MKYNYKKTNYQFWNRKYDSPNVESFMFRLKPKLLDYYINRKKKLKVLDFGCGEGSNIKYLIKKYNYDGYGVDISPISIKECYKKKLNKKKFKIIDPDVKEDDDYFNVKFDLIISIQVLYFINDDDLKKRLISLNQMLKPGGYVFFTMMGSENHNIKLSSNGKKDSTGLTKASYSTDKQYRIRNKQNTYVCYLNYTKNENDLKKKFNLFKPLNIGFYDNSLISLKRSGFHYTFFGQKKS